MTETLAQLVAALPAWVNPTSDRDVLFRWIARARPDTATLAQAYRLLDARARQQGQAKGVA
jgi:hypothetical protein